MGEHPAKDQLFINKLSGIILSNLEDESFGVSELVHQAGISHYSLKRRLQAITNRSVKQFIREVRLQKAMEILQQEEVNISEVAYRVGFSSPAYFNTCFHELFGFPPGEVKKGDFVSTIVTKSPQIIKKTRTKRTIFVGSFIILVFAVLGYLAYIFFIKNSFMVASEPLNRAKKSIVVLPFKNLSETGDSQYFMDGLMEEIHSNLSRIHDLRVISRTSAEKFRNSAKSIPEIARELKVHYVVEGSGQKYGNKFRLIVKLYNATYKETCLCVKSYDQEVTETDDLFRITGRIAQAIAEELKTAITPEEKQIIKRVPTTNLSALDFYLRGREEEGKFPYYDLTASSAVLAGLTPSTEQAFARAEKMYTTALQYDPSFALAYTALAAIYWRKNYHREYFSENFLDSVLFLAEKALSWDDQLPDVYYIRGMYYTEKGNLKQALQDFDKALDLNPNFWQAYYGKGLIVNDYLMAIQNLLEAASLHPGPGLADIYEKISFRLSEAGFHELAEKYSKETIKLRMDSVSYYFWLWMYEFKHQKCLAFYEKRYSMDSTELTAIEFLSDYYELAGQYEKNLKFVIKLLYRYKMEGRKRINHLQRVGYAYSKNGLEDRAAYYFNEQIAYCHETIRLGHPYGRSAAYYDLAGVYAYQGEISKAYENLKIFNQHSGNYLLWIIRYIKHDPLFNGIRNEPEFQKIVMEMEARYTAEHERVGKWLREQGLL
ncbi:MAG: helix-turn-helix domain-containing protein [Bacteroidales bacterium]|nr:helix-turn-helix domain-containing protein [Bacteroidales bacterium]